MAATGLGLVFFTITHLAGNLQLLFPDQGASFNKYAKGLEDLEAILEVAELGLLGALLVHVAFAFWLRIGNTKARPIPYAAGLKSKGGPTHGNVASRNMIWAGVILLAFLIFHILQFKYGPGIEEGYSTLIHNTSARDLYRLVVEEFQKPWVVGVYLVAMLALGMHIRHGFWSAFQSLGIAFPRWTRFLDGLAILLALVLAGGFAIIPIYLFMKAQG